ncbi:conjugative transfer TraG domain protein [Orientia tsutsugamushi str. UT144]|uniref:Conjugative transfer TraG domain protein n=1 Tax=Orientia tsutsugamushi str. UT144 TaxID=1441384 RepID=A0A0F3RL17_ORITS|nr:conjugative transfer TraG domain protein [Orientia tsutsugamushi str. UT144]
MNNHINDSNFSTKEDLQNTFEKNVEQLQAKASNIHNNSNIMHAQNIKQTFIDNEKIKNLDQISDSIKNKTKKNQEEFDNTSNSALVLAGKEVLKAAKDLEWNKKQKKD